MVRGKREAHLIGRLAGGGASCNLSAKSKAKKWSKMAGRSHRFSLFWHKTCVEEKEVPNWGALPSPEAEVPLWQRASCEARLAE